MHTKQLARTDEKVQSEGSSFRVQSTENPFPMQTTFLQSSLASFYFEIRRTCCRYFKVYGVCSTAICSCLMLFPTSRTLQCSADGDNSLQLQNEDSSRLNLFDFEFCEKI